MGAVQIWQQGYLPQQCLSCGLEGLVKFGQVFVLFLGAFIADFEYSLFIVNVIKCYPMAYCFVSLLTLRRFSLRKHFKEISPL